MGREEQLEEREVLDSIFPDEITDISESSYKVSIPLDVEHQDEEAEKPCLFFTISYPPDYPDVAPNLDLTLEPSSLSPDYLDIAKDKPQLLDSLKGNIEENLGMAMIFTLISTLRENTEQLILERQQAAEAVKDEEAQRQEEAENAKFQGEAVTRESFLAWRDKFRAEMEENQVKEEAERETELGKKKIKMEEKLTGRQLWEKGMVGKIDEDEDEGEVDAIERLKIG
ncbi:hypothetical protein G7Y79_00013g034360 [Physcia stellaris]|nr:hypothetical protein G7Y79_00013g034360 [Physcia stellaris]